MIFREPPPLQKGDTIGITCPSGYVSEQRVAYCKTVLESWGYKVELGNTVGKGQNYFAGTDQERLDDLQKMLDDEHIKTILMGRGGYGLSRIIDDLHFDKFRTSPKWICGFSDITVLHQHILSQTQIAVMHCPMSAAFTPTSANSPHILAIKKLWSGEATDINFSVSSSNITGRCEGVLLGGNLAILAHICGSKSLTSFDDALLFIEDVGEHYYKIDRMLMTLKRARCFEKIKGVLVGNFTDTEDTERPFGQGLEEIISSHFKSQKIPIAFNFPSGHEDINYPLKFGAFHSLVVSETNCHLAEMRVV